jgi:hypothetical protein
MNKVDILNRYLYDKTKEAMFIVLTENSDEDYKTKIAVNINSIMYVTRCADETVDEEMKGSFVYINNGEYIQAAESANEILKKINNAIHKPILNLN